MVLDVIWVLKIWLLFDVLIGMGCVLYELGYKSFWVCGLGLIRGVFGLLFILSIDWGK